MTKVELIKEWLDYSHTDLKSAEYLTGMKPVPLEIICYHCQQSVEKVLKAYLIFIDIRPPKTHDLDVLIEQCLINEKIAALRDVTIPLNDYSIVVRYPSALDLTTEDMEQAIQISKTVFETVKSEIEI